MRRHPWSVLAVCLLLGVAARAQAPDITGRWTASFDTQIGVQEYTYEFVVKEGTLTGKASSNIGSATIQDGRVEGDQVSFVEMLKFQDMEIRITYTGKIASSDEIRFTRQVGDFATEELVAKRAR